MAQKLARWGKPKNRPSILAWFLTPVIKIGQIGDWLAIIEFTMSSAYSFYQVLPRDPMFFNTRFSILSHIFTMAAQNFGQGSNHRIWPSRLGQRDSASICWLKDGPDHVPNVWSLTKYSTHIIIDNMMIYDVIWWYMMIHDDIWWYMIIYIYMIYR